MLSRIQLDLLDNNNNNNIFRVLKNASTQVCFQSIKYCLDPWIFICFVYNVQHNNRQHTHLPVSNNILPMTNGYRLSRTRNNNNNNNVLLFVSTFVLRDSFSFWFQLPTFPLSYYTNNVVHLHTNIFSFHAQYTYVHRTPSLQKQKLLNCDSWKSLKKCFDIVYNRSCSSI